MGERLNLEATIDRWPLKTPFRISGFTFEHSDVVTVTVSDGRRRGRGEGAGVYYRGDTAKSVLAEVEAARELVEGGVTREALREAMPAGGGRNAIDCALWELEAARAGEPVWRLALDAPPRPLLTTCTVGADTPEAMAAGARAFAGARAIKLKLIGDADDEARVAAVRGACPDVWLAVDANQGFSPASLRALLPALVRADVKLIEQPLPIGAEAELDGFDSPIPLAADESVQGLDGIADLVGRFQVMNIKLDKCGGLTEALMMAHEARRRGLKVMVGNMSGTSLAMAPSFVVGQLCDVVDLDGPLLLARDRDPPVRYEDGYIHCDAAVWGGG
ncbi:MAG TPA: dipeptide epimerase [Caulobacteraceae bacterium]|nr:dipeptide epimerase [Caulobacteraceae bacterium]